MDTSTDFYFFMEWCQMLMDGAISAAKTLFTGLTTNLNTLLEQANKMDNIGIPINSIPIIGELSFFELGISSLPIVLVIALVWNFVT